ncbi:MAG: acetolactate synthase small subunit, partial [Pseudomonadota bacterium]
IFRSKIIDVTESTYIIELTGDSDKLDAFVKSVGDESILEVVRSGVTGIARGERGLKV